MKSILLASASIVGFAGAAAAEVTFGGSAGLGYNDNVKGGFYWDGDVSVTMSKELNNGLTATATFGLNIVDNDLGADVTVDGNWAVSLTSETAGLHFGDVDNATETLWSGIDGMEADSFDEDDPRLFGDATLRGDVTLGAVQASLSYNAAAGGDLEGLQVAADATFGAFNVGVAYQDDSFTGSEVIGVSAGTTLGAATVALAYADNGVEDSIGVSVGYPVGPVSLGAYFATNSVSGDAYGLSASYAAGAITVDAGYDVDTAGEGLFDVEATYDVGNGIKAWVGVLDNGDAYYVAGTMDLGGDASLLVSYADDGDDAAAADDIGAPELNDGTTAKISFSF